MSRGQQTEILERSYIEYCEKLVHFATVYLGSRQEAENVVQNFFLYLLEKDGDMDEIKSMRDFLFHGVKNRCIDHLRVHTKRENSKVSIDDTVMGAMTLAAAASEKFDEFDSTYQELEKMIDAAVEALPEKSRRIFVMSRTEGMSHKQIAEALGVAPSTVNNQIYTAMNKIRDHLTRTYSYFRRVDRP